MTAYLERMTTATRMLAEIGSAQDAWDVARLAEAARTLAKMQSLGVEASNHATAIKAKAMLRLADLYDEGQQRGEIPKAGRPNNSPRRGELPERLTAQRIHEARQLRDGLTDDDIDSAAQKANRAGTQIGVKRLLRVARENVAEQRRQEPVIPVTTITGVTIHHGDFRKELAGLEPGTVDAIITDPPYPDEFIPLFGDLSALAARVLRPSGVLAVMTGGLRLPQWLAELSTHMRYRWTGAYIVQGPRSRVHAAKVANGWKPILIYQRHDAADLAFILDDLFDSAGDDKRFHHWGQSESGIAELVERLTKPGQLVVDPFLGGGTTAVVCRDLGRRFIGCDIDAAAVLSARERVA